MKRHGKQRGVGLIELMIAMTIGLVLISGAMTVFMNSRKSYGVSESVARLQETGRYAVSVMEPDIRLANYWGLLKGASVIANQASQGVAPGAVAPGAAANVCGNNFAIDLNSNLQGDNDGYVISPGRLAGCDALPDIATGVAWPTNPVATADTLTVRRASAQATLVSVPNLLMVCSSRVVGTLISNGAACTAPPAGQLANLIVNSYYVDRNSAQQAGLPSLRRKVVTTDGANIVFRDQEVTAGVEDMQVQFGIDPFGNTGIAQRYVDPNGVPAGSQVVAVRLWLLVRADTAEAGFTDNTVYEYGNRLQANGVTGDLNSVAGAGMAYQPAANADASFTGPQHVRRLLITRTIQIRNALGT
jgi:type IV pilus assembly protein PilW